MKKMKMLIGMITCAVMTIAGLQPAKVADALLLQGGDAENVCARDGCKPQNTVTSNFSGGSNTCSVTVDVSKGDVVGVNREGSCNCSGGDCAPVVGAVCRASSVFTVVVLTGNGFKFCGATGWALTATTATITLDSGDKACGTSGSASANASLFISCGACGALDAASNAWVVTVRSQCYGCPAWNADC
jgi:hypothetical protein